MKTNSWGIVGPLIVLLTIPCYGIEKQSLRQDEQDHDGSLVAIHANNHFDGSRYQVFYFLRHAGIWIMTAQSVAPEDVTRFIDIPSVKIPEMMQSAIRTGDWSWFYDGEDLYMRQCDEACDDAPWRHVRTYRGDDREAYREYIPAFTFYGDISRGEVTPHASGFLQIRKEYTISGKPGWEVSVFDPKTKFLVERRQVLDDVLSSVFLVHASEYDVEDILRLVHQHDILGSPRGRSVSEHGQPLNGPNDVSGVGMSIKEKNGRFEVVSLHPYGPASSGGIVVGDHVLAIDGTPASSMSFIEVIQKIRGPTGTVITLTVAKPNGDEMAYELVRAPLFPY